MYTDVQFMSMASSSTSDRMFLASVAKLAYSNPFLPERAEFEQVALGRDFLSGQAVWSASVADPEASSPNVGRIHARLGPLIEKIHTHVKPGDSLYEECVHHLLYQRYYPDLGAAEGTCRFYERFLNDWNRYFHGFPAIVAPAHMFACFRQVRRAFHHIFDNIIGNSMPAAQLRASVWQSVFTHDMRRYRRTLFARMRDFPTLITGPSGTGKELVARAIAGSRYVPFDPVRMRFADPPGEAFIAINIAALSSTLIESELFGHRRGAFTGAIADRKGWLDACPPAGSVFLDELGEMEGSIQVRLLRVLETRQFSAVGDTAVREFSGKLIAATNRDLGPDMAAGRFRADLYYRLCADLIRTPSLREQISDSPHVLHDLLLFMVRRAVGNEAELCLPEVEEWVEANLPRDYEWPGNYRELEQCVRNVLIRKRYDAPAHRATTGDDPFFQRFRAGELTAEQVLSYYAALVYRKTGSYEEAARRMAMDRRTVKAKAMLGGSGSH